MDVRVGAHIGLVVGLCMALGLCLSMAGWGLIARFALHSMGSFDEQMAQVAVLMQKTLQQKAAEQQTTVPAEMMGFIATPEFRAVYVLLCCGIGYGVSAGAVHAGRGVCGLDAHAAPACGVVAVQFCEQRHRRCCYHQQRRNETVRTGL